MNPNCGIYCITNLTNGKAYIGSSKRLSTRRYEHFQTLKMGKHRNSHLQRAYNLDGGENFQWEVLINCEEKDLTYREDWFMSFFDSRDGRYGYNLLSSDRKEMSEQTRAKISANNARVWLGKKLTSEHRARIAANSKVGTPEVRAKISTTLTGRPSSKKDKPLSDEVRAKISTSLTGKKQSLETRAKRASSMAGYIPTEETRNKISSTLKGHSVSEETRAKLSKAGSKNWIVTHPNGTEEEITNLHRFCKEHGLNTCNMSHVAHGIQKQHKGWKCRED